MDMYNERRYGAWRYTNFQMFKMQQACQTTCDVARTSVHTGPESDQVLTKLVEDVDGMNYN